MNADVIIPCTVATPHLWYVAQVGVRTCKASTEARVHVLCNNSPDDDLRNTFWADCQCLGVDFYYFPDEPWNMNQFFNRGIDLTSREYIAFCNQDMIFYPHWLEDLIYLWEKEPKYFLLMPWCQSRHKTAFCKETVVNEMAIRECHDVTSGVTVMRRKDGYRFDEQFCDVEQDTDLQFHCERNGLKRGVALNSRVDHLFNTVRNSIDMSVAVGIEDHKTKARELLRQKWGFAE